MTKISLDDVSEAIKKAGVAAEQAKLVFQHLSKVVEEEKALKESTSGPKLKNEFGVVIYDNDGSLSGKELVASIYTIPEGNNHAEVLYKISEAAKTQNESVRKKKLVVTTIGEAFEFLKRKFIKEKQVNLKTKSPVRVIISNNSFTN